MYPIGVSATGYVSGVLVWGEVDDSQNPDWQNINDSQTSTWVDVDDSQSPNWVPIAA